MSIILIGCILYNISPSTRAVGETLSNVICVALSAYATVPIRLSAAGEPTEVPI